MSRRKSGASGLDRDRYLESLKDALATGALSFDEYESKIGRVYTAETESELEVLMPNVGARPSRRRWPRRPAVLAALTALVLIGLLVILLVPGSARPAGNASSPLPSRALPPTSGRILPPTSARALQSRSSSVAPSTAPSTLPAAPPTTSPSAVATSAPDVNWYATHPWSTPGNGAVAIVTIDRTDKVVTIDDGRQDVGYPVCPGFRAVIANGAAIPLASLSPGDFVTAAVNAIAPCLTSVAVLAAPAVAECTGGPGIPGDGEAVWAGFNETAHAVPTRGQVGGPLDVWRWCSPPAVVGPNGTATAMAQIPIGTAVRLGLSGTGWVTDVAVES